MTCLAKDPLTHLKGQGCTCSFNVAIKLPVFDRAAFSYSATL